MSDGSKSMSEAALLDVRGIGKRFGDFVAVDDVSLRIEPHTVHSVIGPNGAGKTTLFHVLTGVLPPSSGDILFKNSSMVGVPPHRRLAAGISRAFQISSAFRELSVRENVWLAVRGAKVRLDALHGGFDNRRIDERTESLLAEFGLRARAADLAGALPHGQQRSLEFAMTMASEPDLVLLDEPTAGVGPDDIPRFTSLIRKIGSERSVVLVEHNMNIVMGVSDRITVLARGKVLASGSAAEIKSDPHVRAAYLGERHHA